MTSTHSIAINRFAPQYQCGVDNLLDSIVPEYPEPFFHLPAQKMEALNLLPNRYYWVALDDDIVVGTVGVVIAGDYAILKSLFVAQPYRGAHLQIAARLLQTATNEALTYGCSTMFLGTMRQFEAAQQFYIKNGYELIDREVLPLNFPHNALDVVFFRKEIKA